jgi:hypothetical protein
MTVVSSKEFVANEDKYFDLALNERVFIKKGNNTFFVSNADEDEEFEEIMEYRNAKTHKGNAIPFEMAFEEIEAFICK